MDYELIVLEDCCGDAQAEVHDMLMDSVFPSQATVVRSEDFVNALAAVRGPVHGRGLPLEDVRDI